MKFKKKKSVVYLLITSISLLLVIVIYTMKGKFFDTNRTSEKKEIIFSQITEEEAKQKVIKNFLNFYNEREGKKTKELIDYVVKNCPYIEMVLSLENWKRAIETKFEFFKNSFFQVGFLPTASEDLQRKIEYAVKEKARFLLSFSIPYDEDKTIDWKGAWKLIIEPTIKDKQQVEKIIKEYNNSLEKQVEDFAIITSSKKLNQWLYEYTNKITIGSYLLDALDDLCLPKQKHNYKLFEWKVCKNSKLNLMAEIRIFKISKKYSMCGLL